MNHTTITKTRPPIPATDATTGEHASGKISRWTTAALTVLAALLLAESAPLSAAPGDLIARVNLPVSGNGVSVGVDCAGFVYYTIANSSSLYKMDKNGTLIATIPIRNAANNAPLIMDEMAWDNSRQIFWAQEHGTAPIRIYHLDPATGLATFQFAAGASIGTFRDGIAYDASDDTLWISGDVSTFIDHVHCGNNGPPGSPAVPARITPTDAAGNVLGRISGVSVGIGDLLYLGRNGAVEIVRVRKSNGAFLGRFASPGGTRDEGLECDPVNFAPKLVLWSREFDSPGHLDIIELEPGTCACGGAQLVCPVNITTNATSASVIVDYSVPVVPEATVTCTPPPGPFPVGLTIVQCRAVSATRTNTCQFAVTVEGPRTPNLVKEIVIPGTNVSLGQVFTYEVSFDTFSITSAAVNLRIVDALPDEVDFISATSLGTIAPVVYDAAAHTVTWDFGTWPPLSAGPVNVVTVRLNDRAQPGVTIVNQVSLLTSNLPPVIERDRNPRCRTCPPGIVPSTNRCPVAGAQTIEVTQDTAKDITLAASDADNDALTYSIVQGPAHGSLSGTPPNVTYTPNAGYTGPDSFIFGANDGQCVSRAVVTLQVRPNNLPPTAVIHTDQLVDLKPEFDHPVLISCNWWNACLVADGYNSTDPEGQPLTYLWFLQGDASPIGSGPIITNCLEIGDYTLVLVVTDPGGLTGETNLTISVVTAPLAIELLIEQINEAHKNGVVLTRKIKRELTETLRVALGHAGRERLRETQKALDAFEKKVRAQVAKTHPEAATAWIRWSQAISEGMEKCLKPPRKPKDHADDKR